MLAINNFSQKIALQITNEAGFADGRADRFHHILAAVGLLAKSRPALFDALGPEPLSDDALNALLGNLQDYAEEYQQANGQDEHHLKLVCGLGCVHMSLVSLGSAEELLEEVCDQYPDRPEPKVLLHLPLRLRDDDDRATALCRQAADEAQARGDARTEASACFHTAFLYAFFDQYQSMVTYDDRSYEQVGKFDDPWLEALIWMRCCHRLLEDVEPAVALKKLDASADYLVSINDHFGAGFYYEQRIQLHLTLGNKRLANELISEAENNSAIARSALAHIAEVVADHSWNQKKLDAAHDYYQKTLDLTRRYNANDVPRVARCLADFERRALKKPALAHSRLQPVYLDLQQKAYSGDVVIAQRSAATELIYTLHEMIELELQRYCFQRALVLSTEVIKISLDEPSEPGSDGLVSDDSLNRQSYSYALRGRVHIGLKNYEAALSDFNEANRIAELITVESLSQKRRTDIAENACVAAYEAVDQHRYTEWLDITHTLLASADNADAASSYSELIRTVAAQSADVGVLQPFLDRALASEQNAYSLGEWHAAMANAQLVRGEVDIANELLSTAMQYGQGVTGAHINWSIDYSENLLLLEQPARAIECLEKAESDLNANNHPAVEAHARSVLALAHAMNGSIEAALALLPSLPGLYRRTAKLKAEDNNTRLILALANEVGVLVYAGKKKEAFKSFQQGLKFAVVTDSPFSMFFLLQNWHRYTVAFESEEHQAVSLQLLSQYRNSTAAANIAYQKLLSPLGNSKQNDVEPDGTLCVHQLRHPSYLNRDVVFDSNTIAALETPFCDETIIGPSVRFWLTELLQPVFHWLKNHQPNISAETSKLAQLSDGLLALTEKNLQPLAEWLSRYADDDATRAASIIVALLHQGHVESPLAGIPSTDVGDNTKLAALLAQQQSQRKVAFDDVDALTLNDSPEIAAIAATLKAKAEREVSAEANPYVKGAVLISPLSEAAFEQIIANVSAEYAGDLYLATAEQLHSDGNIDRAYRLASLGRYTAKKLHGNKLFSSLGSALLSLEVDLQSQVSPETLQQVSALTRKPTPAWAKKVGRLFGVKS